MIDPYNEAVGRKLRSVRRQKGMSLQDVEAASNDEFKASVLGAYERGERSLSIPRLQRLAEFYTVPVDYLLPGAGRSDDSGPPPGGITVDLTKIEDGAEDTEVIDRFLGAIQLMRQDFNGRVLTIRRTDLQLLARLLDSDEASLGERLTGSASTR